MCFLIQSTAIYSLHPNVFMQHPAFLFSLPKVSIVSTLQVSIAILLCLHPILPKKKGYLPSLCLLYCVHLFSIASLLIQRNTCCLNTKGLCKVSFPYLTVQRYTFIYI